MAGREKELERRGSEYWGCGDSPRACSRVREVRDTFQAYLQQPVLAITNNVFYCYNNSPLSWGGGLKETDPI